MAAATPEHGPAAGGRRWPLRTHIGRARPRLPDPVEQQAYDLKPRGLWYSIRGPWHDRAPEGAPGRAGPPDAVWDVGLARGATRRIATLRTARDVSEFGERFAARVGLPWDVVEWGRVAASYDGVEVRGFGRISRELAAAVPPDELTRRYKWFSSLDADCGCVWNPCAVSAVSRAGEARDFRAPRGEGAGSIGA